MLVLNYIQWCGERGWWTPVGWTHQLVQVQDSLLVREGGEGRGPYRGRILGLNWDNSLKSFPPCYSQLPLLTVTAPPSPLEQKWFETGLQCKHCTVYGNLMSEISQAYAQKPQRNCTFMNSASERDLLIPYLYNVHSWNSWWQNDKLEKGVKGTVSQI